MKKICLLFITSLLIAATSLACAATSFDFVYSQDDASEKIAQPAEESLVDDGSVYVRYRRSGSGVDDEYTNLFRVYETSSATESPLRFVASKWVASGLFMPVLSRGTKKGMYYTVSGRINTNYFLVDGVNEIHLTGQFDIR